MVGSGGAAGAGAESGAMAGSGGQDAGPNEGGPAQTGGQGDSGLPTSAGSDAANDDGAAAFSDGGGETGGTGGDTPPDRPLAVDKTNPQLYTINFKPSDADPTAMAHDDVQAALVDTTKPLQAKLVVTLSGTNNPPGPLEVGSFAAALGFHVYVIAYENGYDAATQSNADFFGNSRFNELSGGGLMPGIQVRRPDSVEERMLKAIAYLQTKNPAGDWGYYLDKSGQVRWSDVIFMGHSHGATSAAAYAKKHRIWRALSLSGPRDTNPVAATWLTLPSATPIDRFYGFTGTMDPQHPDHIKSMQIMGYLGVLTNVATTPAPYGNSHRLEYNGAHTDSENCANFAAVCKYMLGVP
jgi:pimeloyl-ACP methyl ester carboxylesterase